ncbi:M28 family metallopeptidase [Haploplasma modicum]|uniref:M28 family metallopeptidase n=1 Tax=Haploplasma modicum TaxID=2150 RepID=UPI00047D02B7|nr:M28 family peptidase [Haploplasma modicum]
MNLDKITNDVINDTRKFVDKFDERLAGTNKVLLAADSLYEEANKYSDNAYKEDFKINKGAFLGWINLIVILYTLGVLFIYLNLAYITLILAITSLLVLYFQFIRYMKVIDFLFKKKVARNVYGVIEPKNEVKKQVIISGHHDSAPIFNFFVHQPKLYNLRVTGSISFVFIALILSTLNLLIKNNLLFLITKITLSLGLVLILQLWFFRSKKGTPGAGDNMASTMIAFNLGKYYYGLKNTDKELNNTRIIFASFDAEEEGLRGARAFVNKHKEELLKTKTYLLNIECLYDADSLFFLTSDINNTVKLSESLVDKLIKIGKEHNISLEKKDIAVLTGGTDAGEFGKIGVEATTIMGMPWTNNNRNTAYHTLNDTTDKVSVPAVKNTILIYSNFINELDKENV